MEALVREGQAHLFAGWSPAGEGDADKRRLLAQLQHLDANYAGGLCKYIQNARKLLHDSKEGDSAGAGPGAAGGAGCNCRQLAFFCCQLGPPALPPAPCRLPPALPPAPCVPLQA